ncbi:MAG: hypothetical protein ORN50_04545, partial [Crocinitomicaceae bacterium]|nr:hypothetical protein [Crocinitomicaceae bacterium]
AMSSSGQYQTAISELTTGQVTGGGIWRSADYGNITSWTQTTAPTNINWQGVAVSASGLYQTAVVGSTTNGGIWNSTDYGITWIQNTQTDTRGNIYWQNVSMSACGQYQTAVVGDPDAKTKGDIWTSSDFGNTWAKNTSTGTNQVWYQNVMNSSGQYQTAIVQDGGIYDSVDYGLTWAINQVVGTTNNKWQGLAMSSSGQYQTVAASGQGIWVSNNPSTPSGVNYGDYLYWNSYQQQWSAGYPSMPLGRFAGQTGQGINAIAIGSSAGNYGQSAGALAIGYYAGATSQGLNSIAIGNQSGYSKQGSYAISIGSGAGISGQGSNAIAIGRLAAGSSDPRYPQGIGGIAIGNNAAYQATQGLNAIAIGTNSAYGNISNQFPGAIAIGAYSANSGQQTNAIAIGASAGSGTDALFSYQGENSIAIGYLAGAGNTALQPSTIVLNASGVVMTPGTSGSYMRPLRSNNQQSPLNLYPMGYNSITGELIYNTNGTLAWASGKTFVIDHPIDKDKYLVHTCLEGPEVGVYYRGKGEIVDTKFITIELPNYVDKLAYNFTVSLTGIFNEQTQIISTYNASEVENGRFRVYGPPGKFHWLVYGERAPVEVEPLKSASNVKGFGPYTWISK